MDSLNLNAEELRDFRRVLDWSQQRMADELGVARNTINRMEKGHMAIEIRTALAVRYLAWHFNKIEKVTVIKPAPEHVNVQSTPERGDAEKQVALPLPEPKQDLPDPALSTAEQDLPDPALSTAEQAWAVYMPLLSDYKGHLQLMKRFLKFADYDGGYSYLFMLQLLERLAKMSEGPEHVPYEWTSTLALRDYARELYKANPQWH
ncbi:helix-turn-helix transcriptional regulator [Aeromonas popoffii]|uniref:helix-turn-helix transcriptional regulator n=1 Tax=Aeromonas popoffii TaxID=70856 RepID=UPI0005A96987|nr:helix-turn-helix transcriptional regulator [Aeromonas popoffii]